MSSNEWKEAKLVDICDLISRGITPSYTEDKSEGVIVINQKCIRDNCVNLELARLTNPYKKKVADNKYLKRYDILVNSTGVGTLGRVAQIKKLNERMTVDSHVTIVRAKDEVNPIFLGYNLFMKQKDIEYLGEGSTGQTELSRVRLGEALKIKLPPIEEQKSIAKILSDLDDKIEVNKKINKRLEEMAQAIFKQWFVDFEFPNEEGKPYKNSGGEMVESELGMIPKGWEVKDIDEVCNVTIGKTPPRKQQQWFSENTEDIKWISIKDLGNCGTYIFNTSEYLTNEAVEKFNVKRVPKDTVILSFKLTVGRIAITTSEMLTNEAIAHFDIIDKKQVTTEYLYSYLKKFNYETLGSTSSIATAVNSKIIKKIPILVSDPNVLKEFSNYIENLFKLIRNNELEIIKLKNTRDILLPKLMSGEIRVNIN